MTAKEVVLTNLPGAYCGKRWRRPGPGQHRNRVFFVIKNNNDFMPLATGETKSSAWKNAKKAIELEIHNITLSNNNRLLGKLK